MSEGERPSRLSAEPERIIQLTKAEGGLNIRLLERTGEKTEFITPKIYISDEDIEGFNRHEVHRTSDFRISREGQEILIEIELEPWAKCGFPAFMAMARQEQGPRPNQGD